MVTRRDLSPGQQATQSVHASFEFAQAYGDITRLWIAESNYLVLVSVADEFSLRALADIAEERRVVHHRAYEPDFGDALTAVVLAPSSESVRLCANLPLALRDVGPVKEVETV